MGISIIIAHYAPANEALKYRELLKKTIQSIRHQRFNDNIEIIVCDDGSEWSSKLSNGSSICIYYKDKINSLNQLKDLNIDIFLTLPNNGEYRGIVLKNKAIEISSYEKVVILDDDHPFLNKSCLKRFDKYLENYEYIRGRVIGPTGIPQLFKSKNAQGTTYGFNKDLYLRIGGFGKYLYNNGTGEDNDILWRIYSYFIKNYPNKIKAAYAGDIITKDLATNRWKKRSLEAISKILKKDNVIDPNLLFVDRFKEEYGVHPWYNDSREKKLWMEHASKISLIYEVKFTFIYFINVSIKNIKLYCNKIKLHKYQFNS